jgi:hypothetical protein
MNCILLAYLSYIDSEIIVKPNMDVHIYAYAQFFKEG